MLSKIAKALDVSLADLFDYQLRLGDLKQVKKLLAQAIKQSSDPEVLLLYRLYRAL
jgi:hypothetical protein